MSVGSYRTTTRFAWLLMLTIAVGPLADQIALAEDLSTNHFTARSSQTHPRRATAHVWMRTAGGKVIERDVPAYVTAQPSAGAAAVSMPLIYDNSIDNNRYLASQPGTELLDFGTSDGAVVSKFVIGYATDLPAPGELIMSFYSGTSNSVCPGTLLTQITIADLPGSDTGNIEPKIVEIDLLARNAAFELPAGAFGYSYQFDSGDGNNIGAILAEGGTGNEDFLYRDCVSIDLVGPPQHEGTYMQIYGGGSVQPDIRIDPNTFVFSCPADDPNTACDPNGICNAIQRAFSLAEEATPLSSYEPSADKLSGEDEIERQLFMEGRTRVIVMLEDPAALRSKVNWRSSGRTRSKSLREFHAEIQKRIEAVIRRVDAAECAIGYRYNNVAGFSAEVTAAGLARLQHDSQVLSIELDEELYLHTLQGIALMNGGSPGPLIYNGAGVAVAVVDSGVDYTHPQLGGGGFPNSKVIGGYDFNGGDADPFPDLTSDGAHGTSVAGIAAGDVPPGGAVGDFIGGVAPGARIYALKACGGSGSCSSSAIDASWDWCIDHQFDDPNWPLMVINNSFGGGQYFAACDGSLSSRAALANAAIAAGITVLASAGNEGFCDSIAQPACLSNVISVGAVYDADIGSRAWCVSSASCAASATACGMGDRVGHDDTTAADQVTVYSNSADFLDIFAPSNDASTTDIVGASGWSSGDYTSNFGGTSAACPYAAGAVAVIQSASLAENGYFLTPAQIRQTLIDTGDPITDPKAPTIIRPRINLHNIVPSDVCDGQVLTIHNDGSGALHISNILNPGWITIDPNGPLEIPANSEEKLCVQADCTVCGFNEINDVITIFSDDPNEPVVNIPITLICPDCNIPGDLDGDCDDDYADYAAFAAHWLEIPCFEPDFCGGADINQDGKVDPVDAILLAMYWLEGTESP